MPWLEANLSKKSAYDLLVLDESTRAKNTNTERYKILRRLLPRFGRRAILTGTPAPRSMLDLFGQIFMLDGGERLGKFVTHFRRRFFHEIRQYNYSEWVLREGADKEIIEAISDIVLTLKEEDHLVMPKLFHNPIMVQLSKSVRTLYDEFETEFITRIGSEYLTAANAAVLGNKLRQLVGGCVYVDGKPEFVHTAKLDALEDLIEEQSGQPLLVAVAFLHEIELIRRQLGPLPYVGGGVSPKEKTLIFAEWNAGKIPVLLAHPASIARGPNLQHGGSAICWYSLTWDLEDFIQFTKRIHRQGQKKPVVIHYLLAENTIDARVQEVLAAKNQSQIALLNALKRGKQRGRIERS